MPEPQEPHGSFVVRPSTEADLDAVLEVERRAFGGDVEAELVWSLLADAEVRIPGLSLVAAEGSELVGHVLFTRARTERGATAVLLAPLAVVPERQRKGVGSLLVREGLAVARQLGFEVALVLGDPAYYGRFGFAPAASAGITPPYPVEPAEAWMAVELVPGTLLRATGPVKLAEAFMDPDLWRE